MISTSSATPNYVVVGGLLNKIKEFLGVGQVYEHKESCIFMVNSFKDIYPIIEHFDKYPLISQKKADFKLFKDVLDLINKKEHLSTEGLLKIASIKASSNLGLPDRLKDQFVNLIPVPRPDVTDQIIKDPYWLLGFIEGEACFGILTQVPKSNKGLSVFLRFKITQHSRDEKLMLNVAKYFECGSLQYTKNRIDFVVQKFSDITTKIIPFFNKYSLLGTKLDNYLDFCKAADIMSKKDHLTKQGLDQILDLKQNMNRGRIKR